VVTPTSSRPAGKDAGATLPLLLIATAYLVFVVYGSLVPLDFRPLPLDQAAAAFRAIPWLNLGIGSRADWVANILLFIPLAFLWTGALGHGRGLLSRIFVSALVLATAVALSLGIEFSQLFFPPRTVSQNDLLAESCGALLGVTAWWLWGARLLAWHAGWRQVREPAALAERIAWVWLAVVFAYSVLPLDLTISAVEIFHKWREGKLNLIPFAALPADPARAVYEALTDALIWLPPALLWRMRGGRSTRRAWAMAFAAAALLEVLQIFVYSRVSDVTDLFTAALGAGAGALLGARFAVGGAGRVAAARRRPGPTWLPLALALAWIPVLMLLFWYPFDFRADGSFVRERLELFANVPFRAYYYGTEFRAVTEVLHKTLFFAPLGAFLAWFVGGLPWRWRSPAAWASFAAIAATALGIELGQVLLPEKNPDTTDWFLESLGGVLGYVALRAVQTRIRLGDRSERPRTASRPGLV